MLVGKLIYLTIIRRDISNVVSLVSQFMNALGPMTSLSTKRAKVIMSLGPGYIHANFFGECHISTCNRINEYKSILLHYQYHLAVQLAMAKIDGARKVACSCHHIKTIYHSLWFIFVSSTATDHCWVN